MDASLPAVTGATEGAKGGHTDCKATSPWITQRPHGGSFVRTQFHSSPSHLSSKDAAEKVTQPVLVVAAVEETRQHLPQSLEPAQAALSLST
jgi:hypothetical protein